MDECDVDLMWTDKKYFGASVTAKKDVTFWKRFMPPLPRLLGGLFAGLLMVHRYLSAKLSACGAVRGNIFNINCFPLMAQQQAHE